MSFTVATHYLYFPRRKFDTYWQYLLPSKVRYELFNWKKTSWGAKTYRTASFSSTCLVNFERKKTGISSIKWTKSTHYSFFTYTTLATFSSSKNFEEFLNIFVKLCKAGTLFTCSLMLFLPFFTKYGNRVLRDVNWPVCKL